MRADGSGPLPQQFVDPDKTLERLPTLDYDCPLNGTRSRLRGTATYAPVQVTNQSDRHHRGSSEAQGDLAITLEVPRSPPRTWPSPSRSGPSTGRLPSPTSTSPALRPLRLAYPNRLSAPLDLDGLLAVARAEAQKSARLLRAAHPTPPQVWNRVESSRRGFEAGEPTVQLPASRARRHHRWLAGATIVAATMVGIAVVHASVPARTTASYVVAPTAPPPAAAAPQAAQAQPPAANIPSVLGPEPAASEGRDHQPRGDRSDTDFSSTGGLCERLEGRQVRRAPRPGRVQGREALR